MKEYLGDSVYAEYDGESLVLTTENGYPDDPRNKIVLEASVWRSLVKWVETMDNRVRPVYSGKPS